MEIIMENAELHLIVLWQNARYKQQEILNDIKENLAVLECYEIAWTPDKVANNYTRFYGVKLDSGSGKEQECGTGSFILITALDKNPKYDFVETSRGFEWVNINLFNLKEKYRSWTNGGHKIHTTNSVKETNHDITLLLGINYEDYLKSAPNQWNGKIKKINKDVVGCNGWESLAQLFYTLNATTNYVVLRNYEILPNSFQNDEHGDIDILTEDYLNTCYILNTTQSFDEPYRVHNYTTVNGQKVFFDFRFLGDNYYCYNFEKDLLKNKVLNENNIFVSNDEYYFYSLVYHALVHKKQISPDYYTKTENLYRKIFNNSEDKPTFDLYFSLLKDFMYKNNYFFTRPDDKSVFYNEDLLNADKNISWLENNYFLKNVKSYMISEKSGAECLYFKGETKDNEKVFIKWGGFGSICKNEYKKMEVLYKNNNKNFLKPYYYKNDGNLKNIVMEFTEGKNLRDLVEENALSFEQKELIIKDLENIAKSLYDTKIVHRDIILRNFVLADDGHLKLIDFQFAISYENYQEDSVILENPLFIGKLGEEFALGSYVWDDFYSFSKIIELLGGKSDWVNEHIGSMVVNFMGMDTELHYKNCFERIFSVKNQGTFSKRRKVITILGIKIKLKRKM